jgi:hypothetical protein
MNESVFVSELLLILKRGLIFDERRGLPTARPGGLLVTTRDFNNLEVSLPLSRGQLHGPTCLNTIDLSI